MAKINDFFSWGLSSGFFVALMWFLWGYVKPLLDAKVKHAKTMQEKELLGLIEDLADTAVTSLVGRTDITGHDKFKAATQEVQGALMAKDLSATENTIHSAVQAAYEKSPLTPSIEPNQDQQPQSGLVVTKSDDPVLKAVAKAPNRANDVGGE